VNTSLSVVGGAHTGTYTDTRTHTHTHTDTHMDIHTDTDTRTYVDLCTVRAEFIYRTTVWC
jgi:hypothetical protein